ncbi:IS110 family RNA-guided transposase [Pseudonocardia dioxanivorans]|uniref:IS110 family transposase n=1 Tax=Pseudonocardia dioxanivorans TaxID=240495 RepID=UPI000CD1349D|nr:IS110 family transposase [Pseudonocardia dioxanivorans]
MTQAQRAWAGIDAGKRHHHLVVVDPDGRTLLSRQVANDEAELEQAITAGRALAQQVVWAIDLADGPAALVIALLLAHQQQVLYLPGVAVNRVSAAYRGEAKTDAKDAAIIADQARMRRDLRELRLADTTVAELRMLTAHRADMVADRTRTINRLRTHLLGIFPALERALDFTNRGPLLLISRFQTPTALRDIEEHDLIEWLREHKARPAAKLAAAARNAAFSQHTKIAGETAVAQIIAQLAATVLGLDHQLATLDTMIAERFHSHELAPVITSMVGIGTLLGAELLAATGGSLGGFASADHLAGYAGLAPAPRDSGRRTGNLHRPKRYNRQLQRVFYTSALISIQRSPSSRAYYDRKRTEGKRHTQAVLALARRRVNVLWAMVRDGHLYQEPPLSAALAA